MTAIPTNSPRGVYGNALALVVFVGYACLGVLTTGCGPSGPKTYRVSGTVTFDDKPIPEGYITFSPEQRGETPAATKIEAGKYSLYTTEGVKKVSIQASQFIGPENPIMGLRAKEQYIPQRYNLETELRETVTPESENKFDFQLRSASEESEHP